MRVVLVTHHTTPPSPLHSLSVKEKELHNSKNVTYFSTLYYIASNFWGNFVFVGKNIFPVSDVYMI